MQVSTLDSDAWMRSERVNQAVWMALLRYCCGQENGGRIPDCRQWTDREWMAVCRVSKAEVSRNSLLWKWDGDDLEIDFYPIESEDLTRARRVGAKKTNAERSAQRGAEHTAEHTDERDAKVMKDKVMKGNQMGSVVAECPSDQEVQDFTASWVGEPASGVPAMDKAWVDRWLARMTARSGDWPRDWRRAIIAAWRTDFRAGSVNGSGKPATTWEIKQKIESLQGKLAKHPGNRESSFCVGEPSAEEEDEVEKIKKEISRLEGTVSA